MSWRHPFNKKLITSRFGSKEGRLIAHRGLDYAPKEGVRIPAVSNGTVVEVKWSRILGWVLIQSAWDNLAKQTVFVGYCHLQEKPKLVKGTTIKIGQTIGFVGNTGSSSEICIASTPKSPPLLLSNQKHHLHLNLKWF